MAFENTAKPNTKTPHGASLPKIAHDKGKTLPTPPTIKAKR
ncbi:hypothetical protein [Helicobacter pylori]|nr:hypothetical protein [Helicobacter pylori]